MEEYFTMDNNLNQNITIVEIERKKHLKASEEYIHVKFNYPDKTEDVWVPLEYRRTGVSIKPDEIEKFNTHLNNIYEQMNPKYLSLWLEEQERFWKEEKPNAGTTKAFFDSLAKGGWQCVECTLPKNPNWARRIQDLKEFGYTIMRLNRNFNCLPIKEISKNENLAELVFKQENVDVFMVFRSIIREEMIGM